MPKSKLQKQEEAMERKRCAIGRHVRALNLALDQAAATSAPWDLKRLEAAKARLTCALKEAGMAADFRIVRNKVVLKE